MANLYQIVKEHFPQYVQDNYPVFVEFVQAYYKWVEEEQSVGKLADVLDIDKTPEAFVQYFKNFLDVEGLFTDAPYFNTKYLKTIKEIYTAKGSERALVYLLRVVYNTTSEIYYPNENILRASDGKWSSEMFITVIDSYGSLPDPFTEFYIVLLNSLKKVLVTRTELIGLGTRRIYFKRQNVTFGSLALQLDTLTCDNIFVTCDDDNITVDIGSTSGEAKFIQAKDEYGNIVYVGEVIKEPSSISVIDGGEAWQLGQIITIPGSIKDTLARVSRVGTNGEIQGVEILEYGYSHVEYQQVVVSPYKVKPIGTAFDIVETIVTTIPLVKHYEVTIDDLSNGTTDHVIGVGTGMGDDYFLEDYVEEDYTGAIVINQLTTFTPSPEGEVAGLTLEDWLNSRAILRYNFDETAYLPGKWRDGSGQVSNPEIRLQDNFYYQQFSYVINSDTNPLIYKELTDTIHPAGLKGFDNFDMTTTLSLGVSASTSFPYVKRTQFEEIDFTDTISKQPIKTRNETVTLDETLSSRNFAKYRIDSVTLSDTGSSVDTAGYALEDYFLQDYVGITVTLTIGA